MSAEASNGEWIASLTTGQVMTGISRAIRQRDWVAVEGLMLVLAVKDPEKAEAVYAALQVATARHGRRPASDEDAAAAAGGEAP